MILLSGFMPFKDFKINPSQVLVEQLDLPNSKKVILPVEYENSFLLLKKQIDVYNPEYVIMFGLAQNRKKVTLEKYAYNLNNCSIPDNLKKLIMNQKILHEADDRLETQLKLSSSKDWQVSEDPGRYVCNDLYYRSLNYSKTKNYQSLFIHLPMTKELFEMSDYSNHDLLVIIKDFILKKVI